MNIGEARNLVDDLSPLSIHRARVYWMNRDDWHGVPTMVLPGGPTLPTISLASGCGWRAVSIVRAAAVSVHAVLLMAMPAGAQQAVITDGDTLKINGAAYRLFGIDAPETKQDCPDGWPAGRLATTHLQALIAGRNVICERRDTDRYGRTVAVCRAGGEDLGAIMVRDGYAWAFTRYSADYVGQEARAKAGGAGVHGHGCAPAWEWRAAQRGTR